MKKYSDLKMPEAEKEFELEAEFGEMDEMDMPDMEESGAGKPKIEEALSPFSKEEIEAYLASMDEEPSEDMQEEEEIA